MAHVSELKEGKESMKNEVFLALHNKGEDEAKERCAAVLHPVKIWHGRCGSGRFGLVQFGLVRCGSAAASPPLLAVGFSRCRAQVGDDTTMSRAVFCLMMGESFHPPCLCLCMAHGTSCGPNL